MAEMTIGELAARSGLAVSAIRFYQRRGLLPPRESGGWQRFDQQNLTRLAVIELAKRAGFTLDEITELLGCFESDSSPVATWHTLAQTKLDQIDTQIAQLQFMRELLRDALDCSCLELDRAAMIPAALGWITDTAQTTRAQKDPTPPPEPALRPS